MSQKDNPKEEPRSFILQIILSPLTLGVALLSRALSILRPYAPTLIPIVVCSLFIPLIILLSVVSGWYVWSTLSVSWKVPLYLQYGDGIAPHAYVHLPDSINLQQRYHVSLDLVIPNSEANIALGNFMASLTVLAPATNKTLAHVRRPALVLPATSYPFFSKPLTSDIRVPMLDAFLPSKANLAAEVTIGRRDDWGILGSGQLREVSVLSASLSGLAVPHGIRGLAVRAPFLVSLASACLFFFISSLTLGTCVLPLILPSMPLVEGDEDMKVEMTDRPIPSTSTPTYPAQERERERRRRRSRSSRSSREGRVKVEAPVDVIPPTTEDPNRGLRRRSSKPVITQSQEASGS